jgi:hypothetical protein
MTTIASGRTSQTTKKSSPKTPAKSAVKVEAKAPAPKSRSNGTSASSSTMRALFKHHAGEGLKFDGKRAKPTPGPRDVLIRVSKVGICGTDRHIWEWDQWASGRIPVGIVTGHEFVGIIEAVGSAVTKYKPGLRVSAEGHITAWMDYNSRTGNAHIASDTRIIGSTVTAASPTTWSSPKRMSGPSTPPSPIRSPRCSTRSATPFTQ